MIFEAHGPVSVPTAELASLSDVEHESAIDNDVDEAIWKELETGSRHQVAFHRLPDLDDALAGAALLAIGEPAQQVTRAVAAALIALGFGPLAKIPLGVVFRASRARLASTRCWLATPCCCGEPPR